MYKEVIDFWFRELSKEKWFSQNLDVDNLICERFEALHKRVARGEVYQWRASPEGSLAEIIVLDQFSRNIYRNQPAAFANDGMALVLSQVGIEKGYDMELDVTMRDFFYLPFMHSESQVIHERAVSLYKQPGLEGGLDFELRHKVIIDRFGRYPHRNIILNRLSTPEELQFLAQPNSSF